VKAELNKLGDAPRAYLEKLQLAEGMQVDIHSSGAKISLTERFQQIQGARITQGAGRGKTLRLVPRPKFAALNNRGRGGY